MHRIMKKSDGHKYLDLLKNLNRSTFSKDILININLSISQRMRAQRELNQASFTMFKMPSLVSSTTIRCSHRLRKYNFKLLKNP